MSDLWYLCKLQFFSFYRCNCFIVLCKRLIVLCNCFIILLSYQHSIMYSSHDSLIWLLSIWNHQLKCICVQVFLVFSKAVQLLLLKIIWEFDIVIFRLKWIVQWFVVKLFREVYGNNLPLPCSFTVLFFLVAELCIKQLIINILLN